MGSCNGKCDACNCNDEKDLPGFEIKFIEEELLKRSLTKEDYKDLRSRDSIKDFKDIKVFNIEIDEDYNKWSIVYFIDQDDKIRNCDFFNDEIISGAIKYYKINNKVNIKIKKDIIESINAKYYHDDEFDDDNEFENTKIEIEDDEKDDHILIRIVKEKVEAHQLLSEDDVIKPEDAIEPEEDDDIDRKIFKKDHRESNPALHMLYTKWAIKHLVVVDNFAQKLENFANLNMMGLQVAIEDERNKLITENAAYAEADEILKSIEKHKVKED